MIEDRTYTLCGTDATKIKHVQDTWRPIQTRFFREAEALADKVNDMDVATADTALARFMTNVSTTIHETLAKFNTTLPALTAA